MSPDGVPLGGRHFPIRILDSAYTNLQIHRVSGHTGVFTISKEVRGR
jgi:hypothetical protein